MGTPLENKIIGIAGMSLAGLMNSALIKGNFEISVILFAFSIVLLVIGIATTDLPKVSELITKGIRQFADWKNHSDNRQRILNPNSKRAKQPDPSDSEAARLE